MPNDRYDSFTGIWTAAAVVEPFQTRATTMYSVAGSSVFESIGVPGADGRSR